MRQLVQATIVLALFAPTITAQAALGSRAKSEMKKMMSDYVRMRTDDERAEKLPWLMKHGRAGIEFLDTLIKRKGYAPHVKWVRARSKEMLGLDILEKTGRMTHHGWDVNFFSIGELVLFKKGDAFGGFIFANAPDPSSGLAKIRWWLQKGAVRKLTQPGGEGGEKQIKGDKGGQSHRPNSGYTEWNYRFTIGDIPMHVRFVGPAVLRSRFGHGVSFAPTGKTKPDRLSSTDGKIAYAEETDADVSRLTKLLQEYLFRVVDGCEPLPLEDVEQAGFGQYESVQVEVRQTRPGRETIVLVKFLEPDDIGFAAYHVPLIRNFVNELVPMDEKNVVILGGTSPGIEGNRFWLPGKKGGAWGPPDDRLKKFLRTNFPECY